MKNVIFLMLATFPFITKSQIPAFDNTFNTVGFNSYTVGPFYHDVRAIAQQTDGAIISAFNAGPGSLNYKFYATRYLNNGTIDNSYGIGGVATVSLGTQLSELNNAVLQPDNKLVIVGATKNTTGPISMAIARLDVNGTLDNTFNTTGKLILAFNTFTNSQAYAMAAHVQGDGKILIAGSIIDTVSFSQRLVAIARLNSNGSIDNSFAINGRFILDLTTGYDEINGITTDGSGNIYATATRSAGTAVIKLNSSGAITTTFGTAGVATNTNMGAAANIFVNNAGTIINSGNFQLTVTGNLDNTFGVGGVVNNFSRVTYKQPDGRIIGVKNTFTLSSNFFTLERLNANGSYDNTFGTNGIYTTTLVNEATSCIGMQSDGKILTAGGSFTARFTSSLIPTHLNSNNFNEDQIIIYPNPVTENLSIRNKTPFDVPRHAFILNTLGQTLVISELNNTEITTLKTDNLNPGVYFLTLKSNNKTSTYKILKK
jgi:uncharacterized delta-60 repeat protein